MNVKELQPALAAIGIPDRLFVVGDTAEFAFCVIDAGDGAWEVFWMERGNKNELQRFENEDQACCYLLGRFTCSQILAGLTWGDGP